MFRGRRSIVALVTIGAAAAATVASVASGGSTAAPYNTSQAAMVTLLAGAPASSSADAIISVGDTIGGFTFESIPDGVSVYPRGNGRADVFVNHETSTVPFPFNPPWPQASGVEANQNDFTNSEVSQLNFNQRKVEINSVSKAIASLENYQRFCSNYLATAVEGFDRDILFTNEEAQDWVFRSGTAWPGPTFIPPGTAGAEQAGVVVAHDVKNGKTKPIYGMGRHNHENSVAVPGFDDLVVLSGDDTFQTNPPASSQLYMYTAEDSDELWADEGTLHAFVADGDGQRLLRPPARRDDQRELRRRSRRDREGQGCRRRPRADPGRRLPCIPGAVGRSSVPPDGPQWILDQWGNVANTPSVCGQRRLRLHPPRGHRVRQATGMSNVVYIADSGRATAGPADPLTTSTNGRIYKLVLDPDDTGDPTEAEISILVQGDDVATGRDRPGGLVQRDPPAGQPRDDAEREPARHRGPERQQQYALPARTGQDDGPPLARAAGSSRSGRVEDGRARR